MLTPKTEGTVEIEVSVPAADRIVSINHNSTDYAEAVEQLDRLEELIKVQNDYPDSDDDRERQIAEIGATKRIIGAHYARAKVLLSLVYDGLSYLAKKFADIAIGKAATTALGLLGKITGLW